MNASQLGSCNYFVGNCGPTHPSHPVISSTTSASRYGPLSNFQQMYVHRCITLHMYMYTAHHHCRAHWLSAAAGGGRARPGAPSLGGCTGCWPVAPAWPPPPSGSQAPGWSRWGTPAPGGGEVCESMDEENIFTLVTFQTMYHVHVHVKSDKTKQSNYA